MRPGSSTDDYGTDNLHPSSPAPGSRSGAESTAFAQANVGYAPIVLTDKTGIVGR